MTSDGTQPTPQNPPAGWYDDPDGTQRQRWFDGNNWAEHYQSQAAAAPVYIVRPPSENLLARASLIIAAITLLLSITFGFMGAMVFAFLPATLALVFGLIGLNTASNNEGLSRGPALWGVVLSGLNLILFAIVMAAVFR